MTIEKLELETRLPMHKLRNRHLRRCYRRHFERGLPSRLHLVVTMFVLGTFARVVVPRRAAHSECRPPSSRAQTCAAFLGQCVSHDAPKPERLRRFPRRSIQHAACVSSAIRTASVHFKCPSVVQMPRHWPANNRHASNGSRLISYGKRELCAWHWLMVPVVQGHKGIRLFQVDRRHSEHSSSNLSFESDAPQAMLAPRPSTPR